MLASREEVTAQVTRDAALKRRFYDPPNGHSTLAGPTIGSDESNDDFAHVVRKVDELLGKAFELRKPHTAADGTELRKQLAQRGDITWQALWRAVIALCADL